MTSTLLLSVRPSGRYRIAVLNNGEAEHVDELPAPTREGNIYKGRVHAVEPSIQSVFVNIGAARNGFLHISDVEPGCYTARKATPLPGREKPPMEDILKRGDDVVVQIIKEATHPTKGPTVTTYLSLAGPGLVLMPGLDRVGVSRRIADADRQRLHETIRQLQPPPGLGFIVREAGLHHSAEQFRAEMAYLHHAWLGLLARCIAPAPVEVYRESHPLAWLMNRLCTGRFDQAWIDDPALYKEARTFARPALPHLADRIRLYEGAEPLLEHHGIREEDLGRTAPPLVDKLNEDGRG